MKLFSYGITINSICRKHWNEYIPDIVGRDDFQGVIIHSKNYRHAELFEGPDVAILGGFRTAEDICIQVAEKARKVLFRK